MTDTIKIIIALAGVICIGLFSGWLGTKVYHAQENAREKLKDDFMN